MKFSQTTSSKERSSFPSLEVSRLVLIKKAVVIFFEDKWLASYPMVVFFSFIGTESSRSRIKPSASEVNAFSIQSSLLAGTKSGLTGNEIKTIPNKNLLKTFFLSQLRSQQHLIACQCQLLLCQRLYISHLL